MVKKFISEWNLSPEKHAKLLSINSFEIGSFASARVCLTQRRSCLITDTEEQNKQEDPTLRYEGKSDSLALFPVFTQVGRCRGQQMRPNNTRISTD
jgi:hypothetical protein